MKARAMTVVNESTVDPYNMPEFEVSFKTKGTAIAEREKISSSMDAHKFFRKIFSADSIEWVEQFMVITLNRAHKPIGFYKISQGGVSGTVADPKVIFQIALLSNASAIMVAHNHPSGNRTASQSDIGLTRKLKEAGKFLEIQLLDHLIILPGESYVSLADEGML